ncbi:helix-turn-helix domain-containing protein [Flavobacteriaceae bacterium R38]|nr:helix-turn-helix domain-containing protein [Flavobacteriaceae bacterium R38]
MANSIFRLFSIVLRVICFAFLLFASPSVSQQSSLSSENAKKWRHHSFEELAIFFEDTTEVKDQTAVNEISSLMLKIAADEKKSEYYIKTYQLLAEECRRSGNYRNGIDNINKSIRFFTRKTSNSCKASVYLTKASLSLKVDDYGGAMNNNLKALKLAKKEKNKQLQITANHNIASIHYQMNNVKRALDIYHKNAILLKTDKLIKSNKEDQILFIRTLIAISEAYTGLEEYDKALSYCNDVIKFSEIFGHYNYKAYGYLGLSDVYSLTCRDQKALLSLQEAKKYDEYNSDNTFHSLVHLYRARTFFYQRNYLKSITELDEIGDYLSDPTFSSLNAHEINVLYARSYQKLYDLERASLYSNRAFELFQDNKKRLSAVNTSLIQYDTEGLQEEIKTWSSSARKHKKKFQISIITAVLLLLSFLAFYRKQQKKNKLKYESAIINLNKEANSVIPDNHHETSKNEIQSIENRKVRELLKKLKIFESEEWFLDNNSSLNEVAKKLRTNTSYLSKVINQYKKQSFTKYLTELRLNYAMTRLKNDTKFRSYTIKSIAKEVGFNSSEPFAKAFKKKTGIYPSYFIRELERN